MNRVVAAPEGDSLLALASGRSVPRAAGTAALQMDRSFDRERLGANGANCPGREGSRDQAGTRKSESLEAIKIASKRKAREHSD